MRSPSDSYSSSIKASPQPELAWLLGRTTAGALRANGWVGVQLFFVLSGYLITTLLLREEAAHGRVDLRAFWARRVLRIWPLYYLTLFLTFVLLPVWTGEAGTAGGRVLWARHAPAFFTFGGNWSMAFLGPVGHDSQSVLWSVCVEEQFYLVVPLIVARLGGRLRPRRSRAGSPRRSATGTGSPVTGSTS